MFGFARKHHAPAPVAPSDIGLLIDTRVAIARELHAGRLVEENRRITVTHPGAALAAQFILSEDVWNGPHSAMLMGALELTPYWEWNVRFLPADEASALRLDLPRVYHGQFDEILRVADSLIGQIFKAGGLPADPVAALRAPERVKDDVRRNLAGLTGYLYEDYILPTLRAAA